MAEHGIVCERARTWAALQPDGELSSFEQRLLSAHLDRCEPCSAFAQRVDAATFALRTAPPEPLAHPVSVARVARFAPRRLAPRRAVYSAVGAAAAAVMALSISSGLSISGGGTSVAPRALVVVTNGDDRADYQAMRAFRRLELATDIAAPASPRRHQFGARST
jgi:predicted anti-sigma-YlaC factor YlaD